jgi:hypothetical protein
MILGQSASSDDPAQADARRLNVKLLPHRTTVDFDLLDADGGVHHPSHS